MNISIDNNQLKIDHGHTDDIINSIKASNQIEFWAEKDIIELEESFILKTPAATMLHSKLAKLAAAINAQGNLKL